MSFCLHKDQAALQTIKTSSIGRVQCIWGLSSSPSDSRQSYSDFCMFKVIFNKSVVCQLITKRSKRSQATASNLLSQLYSLQTLTLLDNCVVVLVRSRNTQEPHRLSAIYETFLLLKRHRYWSSPHFHVLLQCFPPACGEVKGSEVITSH
jgi:hypothetical protein